MHDLANSLSVLEGLVLVTTRSLKKDNPQLVNEIEKLTKSLDYSKKAIDSLQKLRELIKNNQ